MCLAEREIERERMAGLVMVTKGGGCGGKRARAAAEEEEEAEAEEQRQLSLVALLLAALRRSMVACRVDRPSEDVISTVHHQMEIGWPTNVQHITHVTFDRFNGFLGLPVEFEVEIPGRVPSARYFTFEGFHFVFQFLECLDLSLYATL